MRSRDRKTSRRAHKALLITIISECHMFSEYVPSKCNYTWLFSFLRTSLIFLNKERLFIFSFRCVLLWIMSLCKFSTLFLRVILHSKTSTAHWVYIMCTVVSREADSYSARRLIIAMLTKAHICTLSWLLLNSIFIFVKYF